MWVYISMSLLELWPNNSRIYIRLVPRSNKCSTSGIHTWLRIYCIMPPNSCRSAATIRAPDELDSKELNLAGNECVMIGFGEVHQPTWYP